MGFYSIKKSKQKTTQKRYEKKEKVTKKEEIKRDRKESASKRVGSIEDIKNRRIKEKERRSSKKKGCKKSPKSSQIS